MHELHGLHSCLWNPGESWTQSGALTAEARWEEETGEPASQPRGTPGVSLLVGSEKAEYRVREELAYL